MAKAFEHSMQPGKDKFLVTDYVPEKFLEGFEQMNFEVVYYPELSNEALGDIIEQFHGIVINSNIFMTKEYIDKADRLKYILRPGSGLDNVDVAYAESKDILVINSPEANKDAVGEHTIGLLISMLNYIPRAFEEVKKFQWRREENKGTEIKGKVVGILGYGNTGQAFALKMQGFEAEMHAYDKFKSGYSTSFVRESGLEEIQRKSDIISVHLPLNEETKYFINEAFINKCKKPFYLLNTSRGKIVNTRDVLKAIKKGKILGAALDVLENEKLASYNDEEKKMIEDLIATGKVIITPHIAGWTKEAREKIFFTVLDKFRAHMEREE
jgi:D-3-phosphoglycerate dehydrogenase